MKQNSSKQFTLPSPVLRALHLLTGSGYEAYTVGGAVRDLLRGEEPKDYDIATDATPDEMKTVFDGFRVIETGIKHGTLTVLIDGEPIEITTYRVDGVYTDARHPDSVSFTRSLKEDAARRDFTVNAMAYHPDVGIRDFFGGRADLEAKLLRTVGESRKRFTEDALRILRALRFSAVLGYEIEKDTSAAIHLLKGHLKEVASERIREEFLKLLLSDGAERVLREYADVIYIFLPEIGPLIGFEQKNPHHDYDVWEHTLHAVSAAPKTPVLRLAALFHDFGKPSCFFTDKEGIGHFYGHAERSAEIANKIMRRLRFDNETRERVVLLVRTHDVLPMPKTRQFARIRSKHGDAFLFEWLALIRADRTGQKSRLPDDVEASILEAEDAARALVAEEERMSLASLAIRGDDLTPLGFRGKEIGDALTLALNAVLEGKVKNEKGSLLRFLADRKSAPIECERKLLIRYPDTEKLLLLGASKSEIIQTYLMADPGTTARVRKRTTDGNTKYYHTVKRRITPLSAIEEEREIEHGEYEALLKTADPARNVIQKTRYALPFEGHLLEIDVYPFWKAQAVLECELAREDEEFTLPSFISVLRDVTEDVSYKNVSLAKQIPCEDKIP